MAVCAPSDKFLTMGGPLAIGLGVVFASSLGKMPIKLRTRQVGTSVAHNSVFFSRFHVSSSDHRFGRWANVDFIVRWFITVLRICIVRHSKNN